MTVLFLQNAWSPLYAGGTWPRESWLKALWRSPSGRRLRLLLDQAPNLEFWLDNTTPLVGPTATSTWPADHAHMRAILAIQQPDVVICCGRQARQACWDLHLKPLLILPHPAYRVVTDQLFTLAGSLLAAGTIPDVLELRQGRDCIDFLDEFGQPISQPRAGTP